MNQKGFASILIIVGVFILAGVVGGIYYLGSRKAVTTIPSPTSVITSKNLQSTPTPIQIPSPIATTTPTSTPKPTQNGTSSEDIKYLLPSGWKAGITNNILYIQPTNQVGIVIKTYGYSENTGRREYYCKLVDYCIEETTYFTETTIGNISGYIANALDNSGGGPEYFGVKGDKFYIISIAPGISGSDKQTVLNSLIF